MTRTITLALLLASAAVAVQADERRPAPGATPRSPRSRSSRRRARAGGPVLASPAAPVAAADEPCGRKYCAGATTQDVVAIA
jgi:hypothetical protein